MIFSCKIKLITSALCYDTRFLSEHYDLGADMYIISVLAQTIKETPLWVNNFFYTLLLTFSSPINPFI